MPFFLAPIIAGAAGAAAAAPAIAAPVAAGVGSAATGVAGAAGAAGAASASGAAALGSAGAAGTAGGAMTAPAAMGAQAGAALHQAAVAAPGVASIGASPIMKALASPAAAAAQSGGAGAAETTAAATSAGGAATSAPAAGITPVTAPIAPTPVGATSGLKAFANTDYVKAVAGPTNAVPGDQAVAQAGKALDPQTHAPVQEAAKAAVKKMDYGQMAQKGMDALGKGINMAPQRQGGGGGGGGGGAVQMPSGPTDTLSSMPNIASGVGAGGSPQTEIATVTAPTGADTYRSDKKSKSQGVDGMAEQAVEQFMNKLSPKLYTYKEPKFAPNPQDFDEPQLGILAQDVEKTSVGKSLIQKDPNSGFLQVKIVPMVSALAASVARLNEKIDGKKPDSKRT